MNLKYAVLPKYGDPHVGGVIFEGNGKSYLTCQMAVGLFQITSPETNVTIIETPSARRLKMVDPCFNCQALVRMHGSTIAIFSLVADQLEAILETFRIAASSNWPIGR